VRERLSTAALEAASAAAREVYADREVIGYAVALADATRHPARYGLGALEPLIEYGASPRGPIGMVQAAQALALLRGRRHAVPEDVADVATDVLRHRLVLTYDAIWIAVLLLLVSVALGVWVTSIRRENRLSIARLEQEVSERDQAARSGQAVPIDLSLGSPTRSGSCKRNSEPVYRRRSRSSSS